MTRSLIAALAAVMLMACGGEMEPGESAVTHAELEEDETLIDDAPIGEPSVMQLTLEHGAAGHQPTGIEGHLPIPPASRAIQPTPMLPGGPGTEAESSASDTRTRSSSGMREPAAAGSEQPEPGTIYQQGQVPVASDPTHHDQPQGRR